MTNRAKAVKLNAQEQNLTWEEIVKKQTDRERYIQSDNRKFSTFSKICQSKVWIGVTVMIVKYAKHQNKRKNRVEFWLVNFDYYDGNDYIAKLFCSNFNMIYKKEEFIRYSIIYVYSENEKYELLWHEDIGNVIYCSIQSEKNNIVLEERLKKIINIINSDGLKAGELPVRGKTSSLQSIINFFGKWM